MSVLEVDINSFDKLVIQESYKRLVILDISAQWCTPCKILEPIITAVALEFNNSAIILTKIEAEDENMKIAGRYNVRGFPTVIAFINGKEVDRFHSAHSPDFVRDFININLAKKL
jgi:putative thioredoxin